MRLRSPDSYSEFMERVRCLCALHNASQTSGIRSTKRNTRVGGSDKSKHRLEEYGGMASDLVLDDMAEPNRKALVRAAQTLGLWALDESDHVHIQGLAPG